MKWLQKAAQIIYDKKAENLIALDVRGLSSITNFLLIAEGATSKHVTFLAKAVVEEFKKEGQVPLFVEGLESGDWVIVDYPGFMVHLFAPGLRDYYQLEQVWPQSKLVELFLSATPGNHHEATP